MNATTLIISTLAISAGMALSQELVQDPALIEVTATNHAEVVVLLNEQLANTREQLLRVEEQLALTGVPAEIVEIPGSDAAAAAIGLAESDGLRPNAEMEEMVAGAEGASVFAETLYGIVEPIGNTFESGEEELPRDPEFYRPEAAMLGRIREYQRVREASIERRALLQEAMLEALENIRTAESFAVIQKQRAVIDVLQTEIAAADTEISAAAKDVDILEREFQVQAQILNKANSENTRIDDEEEAEEAGEQADLEALIRQEMPWGPRQR